MGIYATNYVIYGFHINKKVMKKFDVKPDSDTALPYVEGRPGITLELVYDQVCGDYIVFGEKIHSEGEHSNHEIKAIDIKNHSMEEMTHLQDKFIEAFGLDVFKAMGSPEPKLFVFTHYS